MKKNLTIAHFLLYWQPVFPLTLLLLFSLTKSYSQSSSLVQYKDTVNNFTIKIPPGWRYGVNKKYADIALLAYRTPIDTSDQPHENFNVNILEKKKSSLDKEYGKLIDALTATNDFNVIKKDNVTINGQPYKWLIETHKNEINSVLMTNYVFLTYKNEKTYILTFVSYSKDFDKYETLFTEIAKTLVL
jgi:hypothetical protein